MSLAQERGLGGPGGALLLRALRGAPISVLVAIRYLGKGGPADLAAVTGYDRGTVSQALQALAALGFVEAFSRYAGWRATTAATQLPLFIPAELAGGELTEREGEKFPLAAPVVVVNINPGIEELNNNNNNPGRREGEKFPLPLPEAGFDRQTQPAQWVAAELVRRCAPDFAGLATWITAANAEAVGLAALHVAAAAKRQTVANPAGLLRSLVTGTRPLRPTAAQRASWAAAVSAAAGDADFDEAFALAERIRRYAPAEYAGLIEH